MDGITYQNLHLRTPQAAEYLGISTSSMEKMRMRGDGPPYAKLGRLVIYAMNDLDAWVKAHKRLSTIEPSDIENPRKTRKS
jgi:predicted DNA-binding transcriptional regulator AlpA